MADIIKLQGSADFDAVVTALERVEKQIRDLAAQIEIDRVLGIDTTRAEAELRSAQRAADVLGDRVEAAGEQAETALREAASAADKLEDELEEAGQEGLDLGKVIETALGEAGGRALAGLAEHAVAFARALVESTQLVQRLRDRAEDLGRGESAATERVDQLNAAAADLGVTLEDIGAQALEGERRLQAMGISAGDSATLIDQLLRVTISARGEVDDFGDVVEALGQSMEAGGVNLKSFLDELERRTPGAAEIAAQKLGLTRESLDSLGVVSKEVARQLLPELAEGLEKAFSDQITDRIEDSRESLAGVRSRLAEITAEIGGQLVPQLEKLSRTLNDAFDTETAEATTIVLVAILKAVGELLVLVSKLGIALDLSFLGVSQLLLIATEGVTKLLRLIPGLGSALADFDDAIDITQANLLRANRESIRALRGIQDQVKETAETAADAGPEIGQDLADGFARGADAAAEAAGRVQAATAETVEAEREAARARLDEVRKLAEGLEGEERELAESRIEAIRDSIEAVTDAERDLAAARITAAEEAVEGVRAAEGVLRDVRADAAASALKTAEEAAGKLAGIEREAAQVRVRTIEVALEEILEAEREAAAEREKLVEQQRQALSGLATAFGDLSDSIDDASQAGEGFVTDEQAGDVDRLRSELQGLQSELEALEGQSIISLEQSNRITELSTQLIPDLRARLRDLGQSGPQDVEPLGVAVDDLSVRFRETVRDLLSEGGALEELFQTLGGSARESLASLITGFVDSSEQVGLTQQSVQDFGRTLVDILRGEGIEVPAELAQAFGGASDDIGTSTAEIARRLSDLDQEARRAGEGGQDAAAAVGEIGREAGAAAEPTERAALSVERLADGVIRISQVRAEGNPLEGLLEPLAGEGGEGLRAAAESFERVGAAVAGVGEQGAPAAETITAILTAMQEAVEAGSVEGVAEQIERLAAAAPALAESLAGAAEPLQQIADTSPAAAEGVETLGTAVTGLALEEQVSRLADLASGIEDAGTRSETATAQVDGLASSATGAGTAAEQAGTQVADAGAALDSLATGIEQRVLPQLEALDGALDADRIEEYRRAVEGAIATTDQWASSVQALAQQLQAALGDAQALAQAVDEAGLGG